jgi:hypothetical protein
MKTIEKQTQAFDRLWTKLQIHSEDSKRSESLELALVRCAKKIDDKINNYMGG